MNDLSIVEKLNASVDTLEYSIQTAAKTIVDKFGENHPTSQRLNEYTRAIQTQRLHIQDLVNAIKSNNLDDIFRFVQIINGISTMIKDDARQLVECIYNNSCEVDKDVLN